MSPFFRTQVTPYLINNAYLRLKIKSFGISLLVSEPEDKNQEWHSQELHTVTPKRSSPTLMRFSGSPTQLTEEVRSWRVRCKRLYALLLKSNYWSGLKILTRSDLSL